MASPARPQPVFRFDSFELDTCNLEVRKAGIPLKLHPQPYRVLIMLVEHRGEVVTREQIRRALWGHNTFVDFERGINFSINQIRTALSDDAANPRYIETIPRRGYRFIAPVTSVDSRTRTIPFTVGVPSKDYPDAPALKEAARVSLEGGIRALPVPKVPGEVFAKGKAVALILGLAVIGIGAAFYHFRSPVKLTANDTVVIGDFRNSTGDPVFDDALKQGLAVQLSQSPFLNIISEQKVRETLKLMGRPPGERLTLEVGQELCQRSGSKAYFTGSIASLNSQYVVGLSAINCRTGDLLAQEQVTANGKEQVLRALATAAARMRGNVGESLATVQKFDTPIEQATTPSLEALRAYSIGRARIRDDDDRSAVPFLEHAIQLDPNFAMAYASLGLIEISSGNDSSGSENVQRAYDLRARLSERERLYIEAHYFDLVTRDLISARQTYELWQHTYPQDEIPHTNLGVFIYFSLGQYDKALDEIRETLLLNSEKKVAYVGEINVFLALNRPDEARAAAQEALDKSPDFPPLHSALYDLAFLQNDPAGMKQQLAWSAEKPGAEHLLLSREASAAAFFGRLEQARNSSRRAVTAALRAAEPEMAAAYEAKEALVEALCGNPSESRKNAAAALKLSKDRYVALGVAFTLATLGDSEWEEALADDFEKRFPHDTIARSIWLPMVRAQIALNQKNPVKAVDLLQVAEPYELGTSDALTYTLALGPVFVRGEALEAAHRYKDAADDFEKIVDHRGIVRNDPIGALAHLDLARAYAMSGDTARALSAYKDFLTLWKDADPDIPILKQAKAEYAKLQ